MLQEMKLKSKLAAEQMNKAVKVNIRALYEQKLKEAKARFAQAELEKLESGQLSPSFSPRASITKAEAIPETKKQAHQFKDISEI